MELTAVWPYALAAVIVFALLIVVLLVLLLRRSAKSTQFVDAPEPEEEDAPKPESTGPTIPIVGVNAAFRRARGLFRESSDADKHDVPFFLVLGAEGSRESDMLASGGLDLPFGTPEEAKVSLGHGRGFWFFDRGVLLDVVGDHVLRSDGRTSDVIGWKALLGQLAKLRPRRPIDGVVVTYSCKELLEAATDEVLRTELATRADRIYSKLAELQHKLGFRIPTYIVVTGSEQLTGFRSLVASLTPRSRDEIFGWSSPYGMDAVYRAAWVDEAFAALRTRVSDLQMEAFTEGNVDADLLVALPQSLGSLALPLRGCLDHIFRSSAYFGSLIFRGIYFCGSEQPVGDSSHVAFLRELFDKKVFAESRLATPTPGTILARNRTVRWMQAAVIAGVVIFGGGLGFARWKFTRQNAELVPFLENTVANMRAERQSGGQMADADLQKAATQLLEGMSSIDFRHYGSLFVPSSWFSEFEGRLETSITHAFDEIILEAIRRELEEEQRDLITTSAPMRVVPVHSSAAVSSVVPAMTSANPRDILRGALAADAQIRPAALEPVLTIDQMREFNQMRQFVTRARRLEEEVRLFNGLGRSGDLKELGRLVEYAFALRLPDRFYSHSDLYASALRGSHYEPVALERLRPDATLRLEELAAAFYEGLFDRNPFSQRLEQLSSQLQAGGLRWPSAGEADRYTDLVRRLHDIEASLAGPELEWAFRREFNLGPTYQAVIADINASQLFEQGLGRKVHDAGASKWHDFQGELTSFGSPVTGPILAVAGDAWAGRQRPEMQLSSDALLLKSALERFLGQAFVSSAPRAQQALEADLPPGTRMRWDAARMEQASTVAQSYDRFREKNLPLFPNELRPSIDMVARERARNEMIQLLAGGQKFEPVTPAVTATTLEEELRIEIDEFKLALQPVMTVLDSFSRVGSVESRREVSSVTSAEAYRLLLSVDRLLLADRPYRPRQGNFNWWDGSTAPSPSAWGASDPAEVVVYLETTRARVATLARYAQPLLAWFEKAGSGERPDMRALVGKWRGILEDLREYETKKPGNAVAVLEDYITGQMGKVGIGDCGPANTPAGFRPTAAFFNVSLRELSRELSTRCDGLATRDASVRYAELARYFNQRLAGRYPFSEAPPRAGEPEADPEDVRGFFRIFDAGQAVIRSMPAEGTSQIAARKFVDDMAAVRAFFAPFLEAKKVEPTPAYDIEPTFRILREREIDGNQIAGWSLSIGEDVVTSRDKSKKLRWTPGEPVRLSLRWATDAPRIPITPQQRGASVRDRTLVYEYTNRWALLTALNDHLAPADDLLAYADLEPVTLAFNVHTQPAAGGPPSDVPAQVFLRLAVLAPGTTNPVDVPKFPVRAPRLDATNVAQEGQQ